MTRASAILFFLCNMVIQSASSAPICKAYKELEETDRQNIADVRYEFESINQNVTDFEYSLKFNEIFNSHQNLFQTDSTKNSLQGLVAEAVFRRSIFQTIGIENIIFKRFQIFTDLILYHKAMSHKGFINKDQFLKAKINLENAINEYFDKISQPSFDIQKASLTNDLSSLIDNKVVDTQQVARARTFVENENKRHQILGTLDLIVLNLLQRNQLNHTEVVADLAIAKLTLTAATAIVGFSALIGYGPAALTAAQAEWTIPLKIIAGCGFGVTNKIASTKITSNYLEMSHAIYKSVQNHTAFACELGQLSNPEENKEPIVLPNEKPAPGLKDYLTNCALMGTSMIFPKTVGLVFTGLLTSALASSSYELIQESIIILKEIPQLYQLKAQRIELQDPNAIAELEKKIEKSKIKITLYMLAFGNTSIDEFRTGIFLYGGRDQIKEMATKAQQFLATKPSLKQVDETLMNFIIGGTFE